MKKISLAIFALVLISLAACSSNNGQPKKDGKPMTKEDSIKEKLLIKTVAPNLVKPF